VNTTLSLVDVREAEETGLLAPRGSGLSGGGPLLRAPGRNERKAGERDERDERGSGAARATSRRHRMHGEGLEDAFAYGFDDGLVSALHGGLLGGRIIRRPAVARTSAPASGEAGRAEAHLKHTS
jgi:hypothetical protein